MCVISGCVYYLNAEVLDIEIEFDACIKINFNVCIQGLVVSAKCILHSIFIYV